MAIVPCPMCYKKFNTHNDAFYCCWQHTQVGGSRIFVQGALDLIRASDRYRNDPDAEVQVDYLKEARFYLDKALETFKITE